VKKSNRKADRFSHRMEQMGGRKSADIYIVGLGVFELSQLTLETLDVLKRARCVYHVSGRQANLCAINPNTRDLGDMYARRGKRIDIYRRIASVVVDSALKGGAPIAFAVDGNPMFFNDISWNIAAIARKRSLWVEALPGVSCIDVLPIQLGFEPGDLGLQILEATQLVLYDLPINPCLSTLVLQVGYFFVRLTAPPPRRKRGAFAPLVMHLRKFFPEVHPAVFIASQSSRLAPTVLFSCEVGSIDKFRNQISPWMTLYLPRTGLAKLDVALCKKLDLG
jgi:hypothetical protein